MCAVLAKPQPYSLALRDQALADWQCASVLFHEGRHLDAATAKLCQVLEKILKGFMLYEVGPSFNPFTGHTVLRDWLTGRRQVSRRLSGFMMALSPQLRNRLIALEELVPRGREALTVDEESQVVLSLARNTEYPFHEAGSPLRRPTSDFTLVEVREHFRAVRHFLRLVSQNPPHYYTAPIAKALGN